MGHGLLEALGPAPLLGRPALAVRADLIHRGVQLDVESVGILELDSRIPSGATTPLVDDRHVPGTKKIANLEPLGDRADLEGAVVEAGLPLARRLVQRLGRHERDRMMVSHIGSREPFAKMLLAFEERMAELGYRRGKDLLIVTRFAEGPANLPRVADEL